MNKEGVRKGDRDMTAAMLIACYFVATAARFELASPGSKPVALPAYAKPLYPPYGGADYCELGVCKPASFNFTLRLWRSAITAHYI